MNESTNPLNLVEEVLDLYNKLPLKEEACRL